MSTNTTTKEKAPKNSELEEPFPVFRLNQIPQKKTHVFGFSSLPSGVFNQQQYTQSVLTPNTT